MLVKAAQIDPRMELLMAEEPPTRVRQGCRHVPKACIHPIEGQGFEEYAAFVVLWVWRMIDR